MKPNSSVPIIRGVLSSCGNMLNQTAFVSLRNKKIKSKILPTNQIPSQPSKPGVKNTYKSICYVSTGEPANQHQDRDLESCA